METNRILLAIAAVIVVIAVVAFFILGRERLSEVTPTPTPVDEREVVVDTPHVGEEISSPLEVSGVARGTWFFEADFPVVLTNWNGVIIAESFATAQEDWMTEDFVPFSATLEFESPVFEGSDLDHFSRRGFLVLQKANPSGLPEHEDSLEIEIRYE